MAQPPSPSRFAPAELADAFAEAADYDRLSHDPSLAFSAPRSAPAAAVPAPQSAPVASPPRSPVAPHAASPAPKPASHVAARSPRSQLLPDTVLSPRTRRTSSEGGTQPAAVPAAPPPQSPPAAEALDAFEARVMALEAEAAARHEADLAAAEAEAAAAERAAATDLLAPQLRPPTLSPEPLAMLRDMQVSAAWLEVSPPAAAPQPRLPMPRAASLPKRPSAKLPPDVVPARRSTPKASAPAPVSPPAAPRAAMPASPPAKAPAGMKESEEPPARPPAVTSLCAVRKNAFGPSGALGTALMRLTSAFSCSGGPPEDMSDDFKRSRGR